MKIYRAYYSYKTRLIDKGDANMIETEKFSRLVNDTMQDIVEGIDMEKLEELQHPGSNAVQEIIEGVDMTKVEKLKLLANDAVQRIKDNAETADIEISWQDEIMEYITRNLELSGRYIQSEILEIKITCKLFERMQISVRTDKDTWIGAKAEDISREKITEEDRDRYRDCCCREVIWVEFCDACSEQEIKPIMDAVCSSLGEKYGVRVNLIFL